LAQIIDGNIVTFVTGANKGLGYETARRLIEAGQTVIVGARDAERGRKAAEALGARFVQIDVTDDASVARAAADVKAHEGRVDVLINNAGIIGSRAEVEEIGGPEFTEVFQTNVGGIVRVTQAFLPLLKLSKHASVVNVSSGLGSFATTNDAERTESKIVAVLYASSKAAVTMITMQYAKALPNIRFNAADPGYTATDLNGNSGPQTVHEGTDAIVMFATENADAGSGRFMDRHGRMPW
jgi:NAD(P)-dependent dehydrogenase (short-subunit alcohol dehydrogenase family)